MTFLRSTPGPTNLAERREHPGKGAAVIVESVHHGNSLKVARTIAAVLNADILTPDQCGEVDLRQYRLIGMGSGIYFGRHHRSLRQLGRSLPEPAAPVFLFSTSGLPFLPRLFHWSLRRTLSSRGWNVVGEFNCRGWDTVGPLFLMGGLNRRHPDPHDLDRAASFAMRLADLTLNATDTERVVKAK